MLADFIDVATTAVLIVVDQFVLQEKVLMSTLGET